MVPASALFASILPLVPTAAATVIHADVALQWTENLSRTSAPNKRDGYSAEAHGSLGWMRQVAPPLLVAWRAEGFLHSTPKFERREHAALGVGLDARYKFGLGPMAPTFTASAAGAAKFARLDQDSGWDTELRIRTEKRLIPTVRLGVEIEWKRHNADSATFDVSHRQLAADLSWDISERWRLSHGLGRFEGDFTANAGSAIWAQAIGGQFSPIVAQYYNTIPWEVTEIYGPGWVTYNVSGRARFWWLEISPALSERSSLALRYKSVVARNMIGIEYEQTIWSLSLTHQF